MNSVVWQQCGNVHSAAHVTRAQHLTLWQKRQSSLQICLRSARCVYSRVREGWELWFFLHGGCQTSHASMSAPTQSCTCTRVSTSTCCLRRACTVGKVVCMPRELRICFAYIPTWVYLYDNVLLLQSLQSVEALAWLCAGACGTRRKRN